MSRAAAIIIAQSVAAVLGLAGIYWALLMQIMQSSIPAVGRARLHALVAIVLITTVLVAACMRRTVPIMAVVAALVLTIAAGGWPNLVYHIERRASAEQREARQRAERAEADARALARIEARTRDLEARLAENRPYAGPDALDFVNEVDYVDLKYLGLTDRSDIILALLRRALAAKLIDPNAQVKGAKLTDVHHEPLFVHYYRANINRYPSSSFRPRQWQIFKLLVASGADLTLAGDHPIPEDLQKQPKPDRSGHLRLE